MSSVSVKIDHLYLCKRHYESNSTNHANFVSYIEALTDIFKQMQRQGRPHPALRLYIEDFAVLLQNVLLKEIDFVELPCSAVNPFRAKCALIHAVRELMGQKANYFQDKLKGIFENTSIEKLMDRTLSKKQLYKTLWISLGDLPTAYRGETFEETEYMAMVYYQKALMQALVGFLQVMVVPNDQKQIITFTGRETKRLKIKIEHVFAFNLPPESVERAALRENIRHLLSVHPELADLRPKGFIEALPVPSSVSPASVSSDEGAGPEARLRHITFNLVPHFSSESAAPGQARVHPRAVATVLRSILKGSHDSRHPGTGSCPSSCPS